MTTRSRKPRYLESADATGAKWVVSYSDVVTILLVLFVALAAHALGDRATPAAAATGPIARTPLPATAAKAAETAAPPAAPSADDVFHNAEKALLERGIQPKLEGRGLVISLPQEILFPSGEDRIGPQALPVIAQIASVLAGIPNQVSLVGHADSLPIHNSRFHNNWELAAARSLSLLAMLTTQYAIPANRLSIASTGANSPRGSNDTEDGRAGNRRVEIVILPESAPSELVEKGG